MKGELEAFLSKFFLDKNRLICYDSDDALTVENVGIEIQGTYAGYFGRIKREICARFDIEQDVYVAELLVERLADHFSKKRAFVSLPKFPSVRRDLAFIVDESIASGDVESAISRSAGEILESVTLFDLYAGEPLPPGKKSLAYALVFQPLDRTLTDSEAEAMVRAIVTQVRTACGGELRA
jgi:phenylalanyl-tRNA synthetase beta chain